MTEQRLAELVARMREAQKEARYWRDQQHYIERQALPSPQEQA